MKFITLRTEILISSNKIPEAMDYTTQVQNQHIENPEFLFLRGKLLIYNGNTDKGKQFLREALNKDPDNLKF
jgi:predicted Zn-dependent protease